MHELPNRFLFLSFLKFFTRKPPKRIRKSYLLAAVTSTNVTNANIIADLNSRFFFLSTSDENGLRLHVQVEVPLFKNSRRVAQPFTRYGTNLYGLVVSTGTLQSPPRMKYLTFADSSVKYEKRFLIW